MEIEDADWSGELDGERIAVELSKHTINCYHWGLENPKFVVVFVHGLCSSVVFNANFVKAFQSLGGASFASDHYGHGTSGGPRGFTTVKEICEEIGKVLVIAAERYPGKPIFLIGHSLGGLSAMKFIEERHVEVSFIKGVVLMAPAIFLTAIKDISKALRLYLKVLSFVLPSYSMKTPISNKNSPYCPQYVNLVATSPYAQTSSSVSLLNSMVGAIDFVKGLKIPAEIPIMVIQGTADTLVSASDVIDFFSGTPNVETVVLDGAPHDPVKSSFRRSAFEHIMSFIDGM